MTNIIKEFYKAFADLSKYYTFLINKTKNNEYIETPNEWLINNYYVLVKVKKDIKKKKKFLKKNYKTMQKNYYFLKSFTNSKNYNLNLEKISEELLKYQDINHQSFNYQELEVLLYTFIIIYVERLNNLCREEYQKIIDQEDASKFIKENHDLKIEAILPPDLDISNNSHFIFELNNQINKMKKEKNYLFKELNEYLQKKSISLKEIINQESKRKIENSILISNIFNSLKEISEITLEKLYEKASKIEQSLLMDSVYKNMTAESKKTYRNQIIRLAKKNHLDEYHYIKKILNKNEHIGFKLMKRKKSSVIGIIYIISLLVISSILSFLLTQYFIKSKILGILILFIPVSQIVKRIIDKILGCITPSSILPKLDYSQKIPPESKTMIVIPTVIQNTKRIQQIFDNLESFYLLNNKENLYFTILADPKESNKKIESDDKIISEYGKKYAEELNAKYQQNIFYFVYRKRLWDKKENCYLGYARRKGALLQLNKVLLGEYVDEEKHYNVNMLHKNKLGIKYLVILSPNTRLSMDTIPKLVGAMDHPLNQAILDKKRTKIIAGYAMLQPRIMNNPKLEERSLYNKIFGKSKFFDIHMNQKLYQDIFAEGSFAGIGIYDLKIFNDVTNNMSPYSSNSSYDLLERSYLRCAYTSDIEIFDDFKNDFLSTTAQEYEFARENIQVIEYFKKKKNLKAENSIKFLEKYKILDNILKLFLPPMLLIILFLSIAKLTKNNLLWMIFVMIEIATSVIFSLCHRQKSYKNEICQNLYHKVINFFLHVYVVIATIPFYTKLYMKALFITIYYLESNHKNLFKELVNEKIKNKSENNLKNYIQSFNSNLIVGITIAGIGFLNHNYFSFIISFIFITTPFILYKMSQAKIHHQKVLNQKAIAELKVLSTNIWEFFDNNLKEKCNYLIPYNYQEKTEELAKKTSPTAIGYSLTSAISAYELGLINKEKVIFLLEKILKSIDSLEKWNGHLYSWYNITTKEVLKPRIISTTSSASLVAFLIVTQEFLKEQKKDELANVCDRLIKNTDFQKLYTKKNLFSIGYNEEENSLISDSYNIFTSESILTSYLASSFHLVPPNHWPTLLESLSISQRLKELPSSSEDTNEYYILSLFIKSYPDTFLDYIYNFICLQQKKYITKISYKFPWKISRLARENKKAERTLLPHTTLMIIEHFPKYTYNNIRKFKKLGIYGKYGLYESYDYNNKEINQVYSSKYQGMSLLAITNYLKNDIIKKYFHSNINIKAFEPLLKEDAQVKTLMDKKIVKYKKYDSSNKHLENDTSIFKQMNKLPKMTILSHKNYSIIIDDRGNSLSKFRTLQLNQYKKMTMSNNGTFLFFKNLSTNYVWSNTYAPMNIEPSQYEAILDLDKIKYIRRDENMITTTEIVISNKYDVEIRKVIIKNESSSEKTIEITSYIELLLDNNKIDINDKFMYTEYDETTNSLIAIRKNKKYANRENYIFLRMMAQNPLEEYTYETEREKFIGRNNSLNNAKALNEKLTNYCGDNIDPILSLRNKIKVFPNKETSIYLIIGVGQSRKQIHQILKYYSMSRRLEEEFKSSALITNSAIKNQNITKENITNFHQILSYLYQEKHISLTAEKIKTLGQNTIGQNGLWKYGISGHRPIITVEVMNINAMNFIYDILKMFEYYKNKFIFIDIIIVNNEKNNLKNKIETEIMDELYRIYAMNSFYHTPGNVTVIDEDKLTIEEKKLLKTISKVYFLLDTPISLKEYLDKLETNIRTVDYSIMTEKNIKSEQKEKLSFDNGFGGFIKNGTEYLIYNKNTPMPWVNVIANKTFGTIISNNGCGYTYAYNSNNFKITACSNESIINEKSEWFKFNGKVFDPEKCIHGFGYTILESNTDDLSHKIIEFVPEKDNIKIYLLKIKNKTKDKNIVKIEFFIKPVLGISEEVATTNVLAEYIEKDNYLKIHNVCNTDYSDINAFLSCSETIEFLEINKILEKGIGCKIELAPQEEKIIAFVLGCTKNEETIKLLNKYKTIESCKSELENVKEHWNELVGKIQIYTPDESFNYMINGWYLYQTISSRILAKAGYYKADGVFNYKNQLQDAINIILINPEYTRKQILMSAAHQFEKGDVLHWWNEQTHFGRRSRHQDDHLWLAYATLNYIKITGDYNILEEKIPYTIGEELSEYEMSKEIVFYYSENKDLLLNHCLKALELSISSMGEHNIPLIGIGDWDDEMNQVGIKGKGESILLGFFLYNIIESFKKIMQQYKKDFDCTKFTDFNEKLRESINTKGWDGDHYLRAFYDNKDKLGSHENRECQIDLLTQSFSIISQIVPKNRAKKIINSVEKQLIDKNNEIIKLLTPPFSKTLNNPGNIMNYPTGIRENGGQHNPSVVWYLMALTQLEYRDKTYQYYQMMNPINRTQNKENAEKYKVEPYVAAEDIYSSAKFIGRGDRTWYTSSSGMLYHFGIESILGIKKCGNKLEIKPTIPKEWGGYKVIYKYLDTTYNIKIEKESKNKEGLSENKKLSKTITLKNDGQEHNITIFITEEKGE